MHDDSMEEESLEKQQIQVLIRPVQTFDIAPKEVSIEFNTTDESIEILPLTQLQFKDNARVRNLDGAVLTRTSLVLSMSGQNYRSSVFHMLFAPSIIRSVISINVKTGSRSLDSLFLYKIRRWPCRRSPERWSACG